MHRPAVTRVLRRHRRCQAAVQAPQHRFFFDTEANNFDPAEAGMLSVAVIDEASGDYYSALVNPKLVDPSVPITNEATEIHGGYYMWKKCRRHVVVQHTDFQIQCSCCTSNMLKCWGLRPPPPKHPKALL